jgi:hypothetical protein
MNAILTNNDMDLQETAAHDFEPWLHGVGLTQDGIRDHAPRHLSNASFALGVMYKTKDELTALAATDLKLLQDLFEAISDSKQAFEGMATMCGSACARLLVAGSVVATTEDAAS